jgi:hypothetical protein
MPALNPKRYDLAGGTYGRNEILQAMSEKCVDTGLYPVGPGLSGVGN